jgi:predicted Fe-Mo cluster-binding NifX family protein
MKIAITSTGDTKSSKADPRFGRARYFLIFDTATSEYEVVDNTINVEAPQGAGIQAAEAIVDQGAKILITGHCGPKAFRILQGAGVVVYTGASATVEEELDRFIKGELVKAKGPDVEGHWA